MNKGIELYEKAKTLIPGGNQLFSKRPERFLPGLWPAYYRRAKGCEVWDLSDQHYFDFAGMGVGACVLGYADDDVNAAAIAAINDGGMCTLNSYEEVQLAEKLIEVHPWAEMARFARTGGEACSIAVRIARAASGRDLVAFSGYHGWHDWYLSANLGNESNLDGQLLPGLQPKGVPRNLKDSILPFNYNAIDELQALMDAHGDEIGVIIMEPRRSSLPAPGFLEDVRAIADKYHCVLIFDDVTFGNRTNVGGSHLLLGVKPDMAILGKSLGNGFPISAIIGTRAVMEAAQETFISSTFWTERIGFAAALAAIDKMQRIDVIGHNTAMGTMLNEARLAKAAEHGIRMKIYGVPTLSYAGFDHDNALALQTYYIQEMLEQGFLLDMAVVTSLAHTEEIINAFLAAHDTVFAKMAKHIAAGDVESQLKGDIRHAGFKRLVS